MSPYSEVSTGDLDAQLMLDSNDEVGELARALDRMRASLKTAIRLGRAH
ncbi:MAG TPA: HAMP domain-containing protein [Candidatus Binatia bacterium]|nr:HAMP domain-containing protein [Candidatus Binatia bacterium]